MNTGAENDFTDREAAGNRSSGIALSSDESFDVISRPWECTCSAEWLRSVHCSPRQVLRAHAGHARVPGMGDVRQLRRALAIYCPLLRKRDGRSNQRKALCPISSHFVSLGQTIAATPDWENTSCKMLSSFPENCYVHLLPELLKSSVSAFISSQWDMCIAA